MFKRSAIAYASIIAIWVGYVALSLLSPHRAATVSMGAVSEWTIRITILLIILAIWLIAMYGVQHVRRYTKIVEGEPEGAAFRFISAGLILLLAYMLTFIIASNLVAYAIGTPWLRPMVAIKNHFPLLLALAANISLFLGTQRFKNMAPFETMQKGGTIVSILYIIGAAGIAILFYNSPTDITASNGAPIYALSHNFLMFTLVLPYLVAWFFGLLACVNAFYYARLVKGILYRKALRRLAGGLIASVALSVTLQLTILSTPVLRHMGVGSSLLLVYGILLLYGLGSILISAGTRRLTRIEVVR